MRKHYFLHGLKERTSNEAAFIIRLKNKQTNLKRVVKASAIKMPTVSYSLLYIKQAQPALYWNPKFLKHTKNNLRSVKTTK